MSTSSTKNVNLPGFDRPLDWYETSANHMIKARRIGHVLEGKFASIKTLRELSILALVNLITDKQDWQNKIFNEEIVQRWKQEALQSTAYTPQMSEKTVDFAIEEVRYKAESFKADANVSVLDGGVVKSDTTVPEALREKLKQAVKPLEDIPENLKDYHPGSNGQVIDLVHPSLFPLVYGRTRILESTTTDLKLWDSLSGPLKTLEPPEPAAYYSSRFQWLPCEVKISRKPASSGQARITSYINNLHPQRHQDLYAVIEDVITTAIPLWEKTLSIAKDITPEPRRVEYEMEEHDNPDPELNPDQPIKGDGESESDFWTRMEDWNDQHRRIRQPEPLDFHECLPKNQAAAAQNPIRPFRLADRCGDRGLQIIVKLANIELTPEKPIYEGGTWHCEGELNERICATALLYYDSENLTESRLEFRRGVDGHKVMLMPYEQGFHAWLPQVYGYDSHDAAVQELGSIECRPGRLVTFSNTLQHRVRPFGLADASKPGHRKILALFLVDPAARRPIISTAHVPPQQRDWWFDSVERTRVFDHLPAEIRAMIKHHVTDYPISLEEAKAFRLELMAERSDNVEAQDEFMNEETFNLCEH